MKMEVELTEKEEEKLLEKAKEEIRKEVEEEVVMNELCKSYGASIEELMDKFGLMYQYSLLSEKKVEDLTKEERRILILYFMFYEGKDIEFFHK